MKNNSAFNILYYLAILFIICSFLIYLIAIFPKRILDENTSTIICDGDIVFTFYNANIHTNGEWDEQKYKLIITKFCTDPVNLKGVDKSLEATSTALEKNFNVRLIYKKNWQLFINNFINGLLGLLMGIVFINIVREIIFSRKFNIQFSIKNIFKIHGL
jgi:hypothetical protein